MPILKQPWRPRILEVRVSFRTSALISRGVGGGIRIYNLFS